MGRVAGVHNQGVRATATAQIVTGDTTDCLKPWAVVDRWQEFGPEGPAPQPTSTFDRYSNGRGNSPPQENDVYRAPTATDPGTGYQLPADEGRQFAIKTSSGQNVLSSGWFMEIRLRATRWLQRRQRLPREHSHLWRAPRGLCCPGNCVPGYDRRRGGSRVLGRNGVVIGS